MKKLSDNILTGFEGSKETWKALDNMMWKRRELDFFLCENMVQTIIFRQHINDVILLPVPRGLKTGKLNRYKKNVLKPTETIRTLKGGFFAFDPTVLMEGPWTAKTTTVYPQLHGKQLLWLISDLHLGKTGFNLVYFL